MALATRSDVVTLEPNQVPLWVSATTTQQYFFLATATLLVYHAMTTLDKEVKYFWCSRLKIVSVVYFANRYIGIFGAIAHLVCNFAGWTTNISYILMIRVLALYSQRKQQLVASVGSVIDYAVDKRLTYLLKTLLGLEATMKLVIMVCGTVVEEVAVFSLGPDGPTVCGQNDPAPIFLPLGIVDWVIPMVYGVILMTLAVYKAAEFWRLSSGFKGLNLVRVLIVDQAIYFVLAVSCCAFNLMQFKLEVSNLLLSGLLAALGSPSFLCVLGSTMFFNLKEAGEQGLNQGTSYRVKSVSAMEFA